MVLMVDNLPENRQKFPLTQGNHMYHWSIDSQIFACPEQHVFPESEDPAPFDDVCRDAATKSFRIYSRCFVGLWNACVLRFYFGPSQCAQCEDQPGKKIVNRGRILLP